MVKGERKGSGYQRYQRGELGSPEQSHGQANDQQLDHANTQLETAQRNGDFESASKLRFSTIPALQAKLPKVQAELDEGSGDSMTVRDKVTSEDIAVV